MLIIFNSFLERLIKTIHRIYFWKIFWRETSNLIILAYGGGSRNFEERERESNSSEGAGAGVQPPYNLWIEGLLNDIYRKVWKSLNTFIGYKSLNNCDPSWCLKKVHDSMHHKWPPLLHPLINYMVRPIGDKRQIKENPKIHFVLEALKVFNVSQALQTQARNI